MATIRQIKEANKAYLDGASMRDVCVPLGVRQDKMRDDWEELGLPSTRFNGTINNIEIKEKHIPIVQLHYQGLSVIEISEKLGLDKKTVISNLKRYQFEPNMRRKSRISKDQEELMAKMYKKNIPISDIKEVFGITEATVHYYLNKMKVQGRNKRANSYSIAEKCKEMRSKGMSLHFIARSQMMTIDEVKELLNK